MFHKSKHADNRLSVRTSNFNCMDSVKHYLIVEIINAFPLFLDFSLYLTWQFGLLIFLPKKKIMFKSFLKLLPLVLYSIQLASLKSLSKFH